MFEKKSNLKRHLKIYEKPDYILCKCGKKYQRKDHFTAHVAECNGKITRSKSKAVKENLSVLPGEVDFDQGVAFDFAFLTTIYSNEESLSFADLSMAFTPNSEDKLNLSVDVAPNSEDQFSVSMESDSEIQVIISLVILSIF